MFFSLIECLKEAESDGLIGKMDAKTSSSQ